MLCGSCPAHIHIETLMSLESAQCEEGFALRSCRFHSRSHVAVAEPFFMFCVRIRPIRRDRQFDSLSINPQPPCLFGFCRVDIDSRNVTPFHVYNALAVVNCRVHVVGAGNTWAVCHIFARNESVVRGLSPARMYPLLGLSTCLLRSPSSCSLSARWYSRR